MPPNQNQLPPQTNRERVVQFFRGLHLGKFWEWSYPFIGAALSVWWVCKHRIGYPQFDKLLKNSVPLAVSVAAVLAGFQGTVHAMLLAMLDKEPVTFLRQIGLYGRLVRFVRWGITSLLTFVAVALAVLGADDLGRINGYYITILAILLGLFVYALLASFRIVLIIVRMLHEAGK